MRTIFYAVYLKAVLDMTERKSISIDLQSRCRCTYWSAIQYGERARRGMLFSPQKISDQHEEPVEFLVVMKPGYFKKKCICTRLPHVFISKTDSASLRSFCCQLCDEFFPDQLANHDSNNIIDSLTGALFMIGCFKGVQQGGRYCVRFTGIYNDTTSISDSTFLFLFLDLNLSSCLILVVRMLMLRPLLDTVQCRSYQNRWKVLFCET